MSRIVRKGYREPGVIPELSAPGDWEVGKPGVAYINYPNWSNILVVNLVARLPLLVCNRLIISGRKRSYFQPFPRGHFPSLSVSLDLPVMPSLSDPLPFPHATFPTPQQRPEGFSRGWRPRYYSFKAAPIFPCLWRYCVNGPSLHPPPITPLPTRH